MLLIEPGRAPRIDHAVVATVLELTLAESRIAVWLAEGRTVREIAVTLGLQDNTLYYHQITRSSVSPGRWISCGWCCRWPRSPDRDGTRVLPQSSGAASRKRAIYSFFCWQTTNFGSAKSAAMF